MINERGFWETNSPAGHAHDISLCEAIISWFKNVRIASVCDFGCGMGDYARKFISAGLQCEAYDGNPNTEMMTNSVAKVLDLSVEFEFRRKFDCVMSLEVGEHIPEMYEQLFIDNLCRHADSYILLSWAIIGQKGIGHVNCQDNDYIIEQMKNRGFMLDSATTDVLRSHVTDAHWFKASLMLFKKKKYEI